MRRPIDKGAIYVAYGEAAVAQFRIARQHLGRVHPYWAVAYLSDKRLKCKRGIPPSMWLAHKDTGGGVRDIKLQMDLLSPFEYTVYFDADTRVRYPILAGWDMLRDGWDMLVAPTRGQYKMLLGHIDSLGNAPGEAQTTIDEVGGRPFLALQGGAMWFHKSERVHRFFEVWREEWQRWQGQDQAALMRALHRYPIKLWLLSRDWNGGSLMGHYHAHARRTGLVGGIN